MAEASGIREKARRWLGHLTAVDGLRERARVHLIVGRPSDDALVPAYQDALAILRKSLAVDVVEEENIDDVLTRLVDEIDAHEAEREAINR